jgi:hypothetical protein
MVKSYPRVDVDIGTKSRKPEAGPRAGTPCDSLGAMRMRMQGP